MSSELQNLDLFLSEKKSKYSVTAVYLVVSIIQAIIDEVKRPSSADIIRLFPAMLFSKHKFLGEPILRRFDLLRHEDIGNIIFLMIDYGIFSKTEDDRIEEFIDEDKKQTLIDSYLDTLSKLDIKKVFDIILKQEKTTDAK